MKTVTRTQIKEEFREGFNNIFSQEKVLSAFEKGVRVYNSPSVDEIRNYAKEQLSKMWDEVKRFDNPHQYWVDLSPKLYTLRYDMIREARNDGEEEGNGPSDPTRGFSLIMLSVATSIDALAVGLSFAFLKIQVWYPAAVIGLVCAAFTLTGLLLGRGLARATLFGRRASLVGGLVLMGIGVKILYEHGVFG